MGYPFCRCLSFHALHWFIHLLCSLSYFDLGFGRTFVLINTTRQSRVEPKCRRSQISYDWAICQSTFSFCFVSFSFAKYLFITNYKFVTNTISTKYHKPSNWDSKPGMNMSRNSPVSFPVRLQILLHVMENHKNFSQMDYNRLEYTRLVNRGWNPRGLWPIRLRHETIALFQNKNKRPQKLPDASGSLSSYK